MHELAHCFGLQDRFYGVDTHLDPGYQCVMEIAEDEDGYLAFYYEIMNGADPFCSTCSADIRAAVFE